MSPRRSTTMPETSPTVDSTGPGPGERRAQALRAAAAARRDAAMKRAEAGLRTLIKDGAEINFRSVARAGSVGLNFLYEHPELRRRIEGLRAQQVAAARPSPTASEPTREDSNIVRTLSAQLKQERARHRDEVRELETRLAAAHEEILRLKRTSPRATSA